MNGDAEKVWENINDVKGRVSMIETELINLKDSKKNMRIDFTPRELCIEYRKSVDEKLDEIKRILENRKNRALDFLFPIIGSIITAAILGFILKGGV